jgi:predicted DsbA family dithiol-disulfide isomerase
MTHSPLRLPARFVGLALPLLLACASSTPAPETASNTAAAPDAGACQQYLERLCGALGPNSQACSEAYGTVALMAPRACQAGLDDFAVSQGRIETLHAACTKVIERICTDLGAESASCASMRRQAASIPPGHCAGLERDYDALLAALREREAELTPMTEETWAALLAGAPPGFGDATATVNVVAFSDFECPFCARAAVTARQLRDRYPSGVRFVFRHFPLPFHPNAPLAARAVAAAHKQGKFWEYHDRLFDDQKALARADLLQHAKDLSLDMTAFEAALDDPAVKQLVDADIALGERARVRGTPTLFVNGRKVEDPYDIESLAELIDGQLAAQTQ